MTHQYMEIKIKKLEDRVKELEEQVPFMNKPCVAHQVCYEDKVKALDNIRAEIEQLPTKTRINWNGCCPEIEYVDVTKNKLLSIIDKYKTESEDENERNDT